MAPRCAGRIRFDVPFSELARPERDLVVLRNVREFFAFLEHQEATRCMFALLKPFTAVTRSSPHAGGARLRPELSRPQSAAATWHSYAPSTSPRRQAFLHRLRTLPR